MHWYRHGTYAIHIFIHIHVVNVNCDRVKKRVQGMNPELVMDKWTQILMGFWGGKIIDRRLDSDNVDGNKQKNLKVYGKKYLTWKISFNIEKFLLWKKKESLKVSKWIK